MTFLRLCEYVSVQNGRKRNRGQLLTFIKTYLFLFEVCEYFVLCRSVYCCAWCPREPEVDTRIVVMSSYKLSLE